MGNSPLLELDKLTEGMGLPGLKKTVTQENINLYAEASRDFNPIHIDEDFARKTPLGGTIAHGMLVLAYVSQMMTAAFGEAWLTGGKLNIRFRNPARPGDTLTINGQIRRLEKTGKQTKVDCEISVHNQKEEAIITGEASLEVKDDAYSR